MLSQMPLVTGNHDGQLQRGQADHFAPVVSDTEGLDVLVKLQLLLLLVGREKNL